MQFHSENTSVFKDSDFLTVVVLSHHLITQTLENSLANRCPRRPTTLPNQYSKSLAKLKAFLWRVWNNVGFPNDFPTRSILSPRTFPKPSWRVPGPPKVHSFQLGLPGPLKNQCWSLFACHRNGFGIIFVWYVTCINYTQSIMSNAESKTCLILFSKIQFLKVNYFHLPTPQTHFL